MAENSKIEWTDHTINWWWGCTKVSPACDHCYAERQDAHFFPSIPWQGRYQGEKAAPSHWGPNAPRLLRVEAAAREAMRYQRRAEEEGRRFRVFTNSMSDFFEDHANLGLARLFALDLIRQTPNLDWLILTKRPERVMELLRQAEAWANNTGLSDWLRAWMGCGQKSPAPPANVWLGTTVEDQERADLRIPALLQVPAAVRFLSCEPLLGPVDLRLQDCWLGYTPTRGLLHQVIGGGESGPKARPSHPDWFRGLRDQCAAAGVPFLFKHWGEWSPGYAEHGNDLPYGVMCHAKQHEWPEGHCSFRVGKTQTGRLLDGQLHDGYPEVRP